MMYMFCVSEKWGGPEIMQLFFGGNDEESLDLGGP